MGIEAVNLGADASVPAVGVPESFAEAFADLYTAAYRAAYRLLGERHGAEDVAQEACARACARWVRLTRRGEPTPWVVRVAMNLAIDQWRRSQRDATSTLETTHPMTAGDGRRVDLHRALETLPMQQRNVVVMRYVLDMSEADTARALGCAPGTVKSHASRGLAALRAVLGEPEDD